MVAMAAAHWETRRDCMLLGKKKKSFLLVVTKQRQKFIYARFQHRETQENSLAKPDATAHAPHKAKNTENIAKKVEFLMQITKT